MFVPGSVRSSCSGFCAFCCWRAEGAVGLTLSVVLEGKERHCDGEEWKREDCMGIVQPWSPETSGSEWTQWSSIVWNQADGWRCLSQVLHRSVNLSGFLPPLLEISLLFRISFCTLQIIVKLEVPKNISVRIFILFSTVIVIQMHKIRTCPGIIRRTYKAKYRTR